MLIFLVEIVKIRLHYLSSILTFVIVRGQHASEFGFQKTQPEVFGGKEEAARISMPIFANTHVVYYIRVVLRCRLKLVQFQHQIHRSMVVPIQGKHPGKSQQCAGHHYQDGNKHAVVQIMNSRLNFEDHRFHTEEYALIHIHSDGSAKRD